MKGSPSVTHATVGGSSPAVPRDTPGTLRNRGSRSRRRLTQACRFFATMKGPWRSAWGHPREGAQVHIAKPLGPESHTRLLDSLRSVISPFFDRRLSVTDRGRSLPVYRSNAIHQQWKLVLSGWSRSNFSELHPPLKSPSSKNGRSSRSPEEPRNVRHQEILQHRGESFRTIYK